jgi:hypothetical protein
MCLLVRTGGDKLVVPLHCIALHCIALHCIALHCIVPFGGWKKESAGSKMGRGPHTAAVQRSYRGERHIQKQGEEG